MSIFTFSKNTFEGQLSGEKVILLTRKHWIDLFTRLSAVFITLLMPFVLYAFIHSSSVWPRISSFYWFLVSALILILWNLAFYSIMIYALNTVIVTNRRIIQNKQQGLFRHTINELELNRIQDMSVEIIGPFAQLLHFGNIEIQTAGAKNKFIFDLLPNPEEIKNIISKVK